VNIIVLCEDRFIRVWLEGPAYRGSHRNIQKKTEEVTMNKLSLLGILVFSLIVFHCQQMGGGGFDPPDPLGENGDPPESEQYDIIFSSDRTGNGDIYRMNPYDPDTPPERITNDPARDYHPSLESSPGWIAFVSDRDSFEGEIYVRNPTSEAVSRLTLNSLTDASPHIDDYGYRIVYQTVRNFLPGIYSMEILGGDATSLTGFDGRTYSEPVWSHDASRIAFVSNRDDPTNFDIYVMNRDGSNVVRVTDRQGEESGPCYARIGSENWIFFHTDSGMSGIWKVRDDGTGLTQLTTEGTYNLYPSVSENEIDMVYQSWENGNWEVILWQNFESGGTRTNITNNAANDENPRFENR
jgi:TolB protein